MKNSSNNNYSGKKGKQQKNNHDPNYFLKKNTTSKKNDRFPSNSLKNQGDSNFNKSEKNKVNLTYKKTTKPINRSNLKVSSKSQDMNYDLVNKKNFDDWIWGKHSVYEALISERSINRIWCTSEIYSSEKFYINLKELKSKGVLIEEVSWNRISQLTFGASHQGIALQLAFSKTISLDKLISISKKNSLNPIILALDGITDPHNVGAIIRSAEAFDCKGIVIPQRRSAGLTGTVAKVAAGALEHLPVSRVVNLNRALDELKNNGFSVIGLSGDGNISISEFHEKTPLVVIVGSEDKGISLLTQKKCDFLLKIPLKGKTSSLNASVAAAISLFQLTTK